MDGWMAGIKIISHSISLIPEIATVTNHFLIELMKRYVQSPVQSGEEKEPRQDRRMMGEEQMMSL